MSPCALFAVVFASKLTNAMQRKAMAIPAVAVDMLTWRACVKPGDTRDADLAALFASAANGVSCVMEMAY